MLIKKPRKKTKNNNKQQTNKNMHRLASINTRYKKNLSSRRFYRRACIPQSLVFCVVFVDCCLSFCSLPFAIVLWLPYCRLQTFLNIFDAYRTLCFLPPWFWRQPLEILDDLFTGSRTLHLLQSLWIFFIYRHVNLTFSYRLFILSIIDKTMTLAINRLFYINIFH